MGNPKKPKRKNSEKRKEKSRDAARSRRSKETEVFADLSNELPIPLSSREQMDKASIMRLCIAHLKLRKLIKAEAWYQGKSEESEMDHLYLKALEGFLMVVDSAGDIIFVSDNTHKYLGITQFDFMGQSIYEFAHPCEHDEIQEILSEKMTGDVSDHTFFIRVKSTLTSKGRNINLKSATYKVVQCTGHLLSVNLESVTGLKGDQNYMAVTCAPIPHPANIESPLDGRTFLTRHNLDMTFTHCDERITELLGYSEDELIGQSLYNYHHVMDSAKVTSAFKDLFQKGQSVVGLYRFLARDGGYAWVESQCTVIYNSRTDKPQCVVCINFVVSEVQDSGHILSQSQLQTLPSDKRLSTGTPASLASKPALTSVPKPAQPCPCTLSPAAENVFQPLPKPVSLPQSVPTREESPETFIRTTESVKPAPLPAARKETPRKGFLGVTESIFQPRTSTIDQETFSAPKKTVPNVADTSTEEKLPFMTSMGKVSDVLSGKGRSGMFLDDMLFGGPLESPQKEMPFLAGYQNSKDDQKLSDLDSSDNESLISSGDFKKGTPERETSPLGFTTGMFDWNDQTETEFCQRAPYIPMSGEEDLIFSAMPVLLVDQVDDEPRQMLGSTETIFTLNPQEKMSNLTPMSILKQRAVNTEFMPEGNVARNAGPPKTKRPMETNRLETGPPVKVSKLGGMCGGWTVFEKGKTACEIPECESEPNSVLRNLLMCGKDDEFGYIIPNAPTLESDVISESGSSVSPAPPSPLPQEKCTRMLLDPQLSSEPKLLSRVTQHDVEVNAPTSNAPLLQGEDILCALDETAY